MEGELQGSGGKSHGSRQRGGWKRGVNLNLGMAVVLSSASYSQLGARCLRFASFRGGSLEVPKLRLCSFKTSRVVLSLLLFLISLVIIVRRAVEGGC